MKGYFYRLLAHYLSIYVRAGDSLVEIHPFHAHLLHRFEGHRRGFVPKDDCREISDVENLDLDTTLRKFNPDYIVLNGNLHYEVDIQEQLEKLHAQIPSDSHLIVVYYSALWRPLTRFASALGLRAKTPEQNWLSHSDISNFLVLSGFEPVRHEQKILLPLPIPLISRLVNRWFAPLPFFRQLTLLNIVVARTVRSSSDRVLDQIPSVSIVVPARNEAGNIEAVILRTPVFGPRDELIFVEGNSSDNTWEVLHEMVEKYGDKRKIVVARQEGKGKGDAVRKGFSLASNEILIILDADLTVPPEDLPKFYNAVVTNKCDFANGSRLVYPLEKRSMRFFNLIGNKFFAVAFSFILGQKFKDTLCGTKALSRKNYQKIAANRGFFGDFDPFGDFDLLFGATRMGLKIMDIPIAYKERTYGNTNIHRWRHGAILLKMVAFAARKILFR
jgi:hypothetical protein